MDKKSFTDIILSVLISVIFSIVMLYASHGSQKENFQGEFDEYKRELVKSFEKMSNEIVENKKEIENLYAMISTSSSGKNDADKRPEMHDDKKLNKSDSVVGTSVISMDNSMNLQSNNKDLNLSNQTDIGKQTQEAQNKSVHDAVSAVLQNGDQNEQMHNSDESVLPSAKGDK